MSDVLITVRGEHRAFRAPERATVRLRVSLEAAAADAAYAGVVESSSQITESLRTLHDPDEGPVTWWSSDQVRTGAHRPWNKDGKQLPLVHTAQVGFEAKFKDFEALSAFLGRTLAIRGASVQGIEWALTEAVRLGLQTTVRTEAVRDARRRAQVYADALGLGMVRAVEVADAGMLGQGLDARNAGPAGFSRAAAAMSAPDSDALDLTPQHIELSAQVDCRFVAAKQDT